MRTRKAAGRAYDYETLTKRDKLNLDIFWLKDAVTRVKERPGFPSLEHSANLPDPRRHHCRMERMGRATWKVK